MHGTNIQHLIFDRYPQRCTHCRARTVDGGDYMAPHCGDIWRRIERISNLHHRNYITLHRENNTSYLRYEYSTSKVNTARQGCIDNIQLGEYSMSRCRIIRHSVARIEYCIALIPRPHMARIFDISYLTGIFNSVHVAWQELWLVKIMWRRVKWEIWHRIERISDLE